MGRVRPYVMSIAGFDPSGGAGTLADVKTFEQLKVYGFAVLTSNTFQTDNEVKRVDWFTPDQIIEQIAVILDKFPISHFKIGIVKDAEMLMAITTYILSKNPKAFIAWDPVLVASSGHSFFNGDAKNFEALLKGIKLLTPNSSEFDAFFESNDQALKLSENTMIYKKGGHNETNPGRDELFLKGKIYPFRPKESRLTAKHGSGCVMAAALTAHFAHGLNPIQSGLKSKRYVESVLSSNQSLLAYHKR